MVELTMVGVKELIVRELPKWVQEQPTLRQRLMDALSSTPKRLRMSYEEFLAWADEDTLAEWVDGEVVMTSPASKRHQMIVSFLEKVIGLGGSHCLVYSMSCVS